MTTSLPAGCRHGGVNEWVRCQGCGRCPLHCRCAPRARTVRFQVHGLFDMATRAQTANVVINRDTLLVAVQPLRRRKAPYTLHLSDLVTMMVRRLIKADQFKQRLEKAARRPRRVKRGRIVRAKRQR